MKARHEARQSAQQQANAAALHLTLTEYLALPRGERKRRLKAVRKDAR